MFHKILFLLKLNTNIKTQEVKDLLSYYEINILPLVNPDGYEYAKTTVIYNFIILQNISIHLAKISHSPF